MFVWLTGSLHRRCILQNVDCQRRSLFLRPVSCLWLFLLEFEFSSGYYADAKMERYKKVAFEHPEY